MKFKILKIIDKILPSKYDSFIFYFKKSIGIILVLLIILILLKLIYYIINLLYLAPSVRYTPEEIKAILGDILLLLIFIELLRTVDAYLSRKDVYMVAFFEAALVSILRKIILLDIENYDPLYLLSLSIVLIILYIIYRKEKN